MAVSMIVQFEFRVKECAMKYSTLLSVTDCLYVFEKLSVFWKHGSLLRTLTSDFGNFFTVWNLGWMSRWLYRWELLTDWQNSWEITQGFVYSKEKKQRISVARSCSTHLDMDDMDLLVRAVGHIFDSEHRNRASEHPKNISAAHPFQANLFYGHWNRQHNNIRCCMFEDRRNHKVYQRKLIA